MSDIRIVETPGGVCLYRLHHVSPELYPLRNARQQFQVAGVESTLVTRNPVGLCYVQGKGGSCAMEPDEWDHYRMLCRVTLDPFTETDEARPMEPLDLVLILTAMRSELTSACSGVETAEKSLSVDDYGDRLAGARLRIERVLRCLDQLSDRLERERMHPSVNPYGEGGA